MLIENQLSAMLKLQGICNVRLIDPNWLSSGYPFLRAIVVEGAEAIEHHGWKWWKAQKKDLPQLQMELVDIWHFALSDALVRTDGDFSAASDFLIAEARTGDPLSFDGKTFNLSTMDTLAKIELVIGLAASGRFSMKLFDSLLTACELSWSELYLQYVSKHVLNMFRQDHGYKEGSYIKVWNGREDNEHLVELTSRMDPSAADLDRALYDALTERYNLLKDAA